MTNNAGFPYVQTSHVAAHQLNVALMLQVRRDIAQPLLEEVGRQLAIAREQQGEDMLAHEIACARALLTALMCMHTAIEVWLNRTLEDEHPIVWPEAEQMAFIAKVTLVAKLMKAVSATPGRTPYDGRLNAGSTVYNGLRSLNSLRNEFVHYKAKPVQMSSPEDPYDKLKKLPDIIKKLQGLTTYGLVIPTVDV